MDPEVFTVRDVAEKYKRHPVTVRNALNDGSMHGDQSKPGGNWRIEEDCAKAWNRGEKCPHYTPKVNLMRPRGGRA